MPIIQTRGAEGRGEQPSSLLKKALMQCLGTSYRTKRDYLKLIGRKGGYRNSFKNGSQS